MALASQLKAVAAQQSGFFDAEITPVTIAQKKGDAVVVARTSIRARPRWRRWPS
jgi:acetyl-CoA C-acetyltransferase